MKKFRKKISCLVLAIIIAVSSQITVLAAGAGTIADPFIKLPHTAPVSMDLVEGGIKNAIYIECVEREAGRVNTLLIPSKASVTCKIGIAGGIRLRINNDSWHDNIDSHQEYVGSYSFQAGKHYILVIEDADGHVGVWELSIPGLEKEPPMLMMTGPNMTEKDGMIWSTGEGYLAKHISLSIRDSTGIKFVYWIPYTSGQFDKVDLSQEVEVYYDKKMPDLYPTEDIVYNGTVIFRKGDTPKELEDFGNVMRENDTVHSINSKRIFESNGTFLLVLEDVLGNQSQFKILISGIGQ